MKDWMEQNVPAILQTKVKVNTNMDLQSLK